MRIIVDVCLEIAVLWIHAVRSFPTMMEKSPALRVLVVDDERLIRWAIAETLTHVGHTVIEAEDGAASVRALTNPPEPVDAVFLDYRLPDSNPGRARPRCVHRDEQAVRDARP